jgi:uncharacterized repeat protein (TIGR01451 family)
MSTTLVDVSAGGVANQVGGRTIISWALPDMSPGETFDGWFSALTNPDLISGTEIINQEYGVSWYESEVGGNLSNSGEPITTVVREVGLIDSFKTVTPTLARPGPDNILTYTVNIVNSGPSYLSGVRVYDLFPWQYSTYQRDAVASVGTVLSDIVSLSWTGNLAPYSSELITFSVLVDSEFEGAITNTARISHSSLAEDVVVQAVAYITDNPVLEISKMAYPVPAIGGGELLYTIRIVNLGQQATNLVIADKIPVNTQYVNGSASGSGQLYGDEVQWEIPVLASGEQVELTFRVVVLGGQEIINSLYHVSCAEGVSDWGEPVVTPVTYLLYKIYLPVHRR